MEISVLNLGRLVTWGCGPGLPVTLGHLTPFCGCLSAEGTGSDHRWLVSSLWLAWPPGVLGMEDPWPQPRANHLPRVRGAPGLPSLRQLEVGSWVEW